MYLHQLVGRLGIGWSQMTSLFCLEPLLGWLEWLGCLGCLALPLSVRRLILQEARPDSFTQQQGSERMTEEVERPFETEAQKSCNITSVAFHWSKKVPRPAIQGVGDTDSSPLCSSKNLWSYLSYHNPPSGRNYLYSLHMQSTPTAF